MAVTGVTMNKRQFGVVIVAVFAVVSLGLTAATFRSSVAGSTRGVSSGVFSDENVTLKDPPGPSSANLSQSPWLQVYYKYFKPDTGSANAPNASGPPRGGTDILPLLFSVVGVLLVVVGGGLAWGYWVRSTSDASFTEWPATASTEESHPEQHADTGRLTVEPENDVHRAWYAMARHLDVTAASSDTPRELAGTAIDQGLEREAVRDLTTQFERVRYGQGQPTAEREQRALAALERLGIDVGEE